MARVVFMGSDAFSLPVLERLLERGRKFAVPVETVAVVTQPDRPAGRGRLLTPNAVKLQALEAGISVLQPERLRAGEAVAAVLATRPDVIVVASYGQILPTRLLVEPAHGAINLHPSLLPRYRGASPIVGPILAGDATTGTTLMRMVAKMDAGPIISQIETPIGPHEAGGELRDRLAGLSADLLERDLPGWLDGTLGAHLQDETQATYSSRIDRADLRLDWARPAAELARRVRAMAPRPGAFTVWNGQPMRILEARYSPGSAPPGLVVRTCGAVEVGTGDGMLRLERLQLPGGRSLAAGDAIRGHPSIVGSILDGGVP